MNKLYGDSYIPENEEWNLKKELAFGNHHLQAPYWFLGVFSASIQNPVRTLQYAVASK